MVAPRDRALLSGSRAVLVTADETLVDSRDIVAWADRNARAPELLFPRQPDWSPKSSTVHIGFWQKTGTRFVTTATP